MCVGKLTIIGSDNGLSPGRCQAIICTNVGILLIRPWGTNLSAICIGNKIFSFKKMHLKMSCVKWRPVYLGLNVLKPSLMEQINQSADSQYHCTCHRWPGDTRGQGISSTSIDLVLSEYSGLSIWLSQYTHWGHWWRRLQLTSSNHNGCKICWFKPQRFCKVNMHISAWIFI